MELYEREGEITRLDRLLDDAAQGAGAPVLVEGAPGIGKSALLGALRGRAAARGFRVLTAVGGALESEVPFGVVRQLLGPAFSAGRPDLRDGAVGLAGSVFGEAPVVPGPGSKTWSGTGIGIGPETEFGLGETEAVSLGGAVHGLYWLCSNLAESSPLLLAVDDAHWADEASLRFFSHLARRIGDLPVLLVLAGRPRLPNSPLARALDGLDPDVIPLGPLGDDSVGRLVRERMSPDAHDSFCVACARASGGNPFLLHEAIRALCSEQVPPTAAQAGRVAALTPGRISTAVLDRLARLGPDAVKTARAIAVLGPCADVRRPALLAGLDQARATEAVDLLAREWILTGAQPFDFVHPLVRAAVYAEGTDARRAEEHRRAAAILRAENAPLEQVCPHLLASAPAGDREVVALLRTAARQAVAKAAPDAAAGALCRAAAEPPPAAELPAVQAEWSRALGMANRPVEAAQVMRAAFELTGDPIARGQLALELGTFMMHSGRPAEALAAFESARAAVGDGELSIRLTTAFAMAGVVAMQPPSSWLARLDALGETVGDESDAGRMRFAALAFGACATGDGPAEQAGQRAAQAARGPLPRQDPWMLVNFAGNALAIADRLPEALAVFGRGMTHARERGDFAEFRYLAVLRSKTALYAGRLLDAEADAHSALALQRLEDGGELPLAAAVLIDALVEQGRLDEADAVLAETGLDQSFDMGMLIGHFVSLARARLRLYQQRPGAALPDLLACGDTLVKAGCGNPAFALWRAPAALAHLALGERTAARDLAEQDLLLARRFGAPHAIGVALRTLGLIEGDEQGLNLLAESAQVLENSTCALERARSLIEFGAALRRRGHRLDARAHLKKGSNIAAHCHAAPLIAQARRELLAAGARPRRPVTTGTDALTASEYRVARLAADGLTNRGIAQMLFVSRRTVELHLTSVYRKLGIQSREQLGEALGPESRDT